MQHALPERPTEPPAPLDVDTVPFVELADGQLRGVVSSGSDIERVYCAFIEAGTLNYGSTTNNNRPDAGTAKRLNWLMEAAVACFGTEAVARYLKLPLDPTTVKHYGELTAVVFRQGGQRSAASGAIFSRFLDDLRHVNLTATPGPVPEMAWFVGG